MTRVVSAGVCGVRVRVTEIGGSVCAGGKGDAALSVQRSVLNVGAMLVRSFLSRAGEVDAFSMMQLSLFLVSEFQKEAGKR